MNEIEIKTSSSKPIKDIVKFKEFKDFPTKSNQAIENNEKELKMRLGTYEEAPKFIQDNEYLKHGYLLHCNTFKKIFKSFLIMHNESVNIYSHLLGAFFFFVLIWYTSFFITNTRTQISQIKSVASSVAIKAKELKKESPDIMGNIYESMKEIEYNFKKLDKNNIYSNSFNKINGISNKLKNYTEHQTETNYSGNYSYLINSVISVKEEIIDLIKLDKTLTKENESNLDNKYQLNLKSRKKKKLAIWPIFVIIFSAIACLSFSTSFHLFGLMNAKYFNVLNRFDYGGISLLISGSCYPPYYYFFYYSIKYRNIYLIFITTFGLGTFLYSLTDDFNKPQRRTLRGILFLIFGLSAGVPILHMAFFGYTIEGYNPDAIFINWYLGGISYVVGTFFYILRFPEKSFPRIFDYFGASHQIFHVLVFFGALFHFIGSLDAYNYRFKHLKVN